MTDYRKEIEGIIEEATIQKTFSLEAVDRIKKLRDHFANLSESNEKLMTSWEIQEKKLKETEKDRDALKKVLETWEQREEELKKREEEVTKKETRTQLVQQQAESAYRAKEDIKELVALVFRNPVYVKSATRQEVTPGVSYQGGPTYPQVSTLTDREEETIS